MSITLSSAVTALIKVWIIGYSYMILSFKKALCNFAMKCRANLSEFNHFSLDSIFYLRNSLKNEFVSEFWGLKKKSYSPDAFCATAFIDQVMRFDIIYNNSWFSEQNYIGSSFKGKSKFTILLKIE